MPDAVDVVERLVGQRDAVGPADPDLGAGSGGPAALEHLDAGRATAEQIAELGDRRFLRHLGGVDRRIELPISSLLCWPVAVVTISSSCTGPGRGQSPG